MVKKKSLLFLHPTQGRLPGIMHLENECLWFKIRASNRFKYRSGLGSGSAKSIFSGLPPVQVFHCLILRVWFRFKLKLGYFECSGSGSVRVRKNKNLKVQIRFWFKNLKPSIRLMFWYTATATSVVFKNYSL